MSFSAKCMEIFFADVGSDDEGVVVWVVLKPEVGFGERDWDMGRRSAEVLAFTHM